MEDASNQPPPQNIPIPDPSLLTIAAIDRAIATMRELMDEKLLATQTNIDKLYMIADDRFKYAEVLRNDKFAAIENLQSEVDLRNQQRFDAQTKALDSAFISAQSAVEKTMAASDKAIIKAEVAAEKRFDSIMDFQRSFNDIVQQQIPRKEAEARFTDMSIKIDDLKAYANTATGRGMGGTTGWLIGGLGFLIVVIALVIGIAWSSTRQPAPASTAMMDATSKRIDDLQSRLDEAQRRLDEQAASGGAKAVQ